MLFSKARARAADDAVDIFVRRFHAVSTMTRWIDQKEQFEAALRHAQKKRLAVGDRVRVRFGGRSGPVGIIEAMPPTWAFDDWRGGHPFGLCRVVFVANDGTEGEVRYLAPEALEAVPDEFG